MKETLNWQDIRALGRMGNGWKVTWEFRNHCAWHQTFLTEAEALAFVERSIDDDPNVLFWNIKKEV